ncbi:pentapeptide repeat-containing protein [Streptomyces doebereineriae]|uniref:Pentapeptide repeat-containing protein n=1 Tax=Streptomyces doebereineriae TaxID=3075528 RepID=A0ABU2VHL8_9ACTN|nr:pentapeptide repeat-containing protein [Streptomyces sp. DSM 41640]MDT0484606.1 pentapeptide repeat-containing protein [Streptomyces sp. DSM 41640]
MRVWIVAPLAVLGAVGAGYLIYRFIVDPLVANTSDAIKLTLAILTLIGALLAGVYAYRKQRIAESDAHRAVANQLADRYTTVAGQLGHDKAAVRLAGVYALARLADDWEAQRQVCVDVLCAYLRMPYETNPAATLYKEGEREVRQTITRVIRQHLQDPESLTSWSGCSFDFTGATFDGGDFSDSHFHGSVSFDEATFSGGRTYFTDTTFANAVSFTLATVSGGLLAFVRAKFDGFVDATFSGGQVDFTQASVPRGGLLFFDHAKFAGARVDFLEATFSGGWVNFHSAVFASGGVSFDGARFSGGRMSFAEATFVGGEVDFQSIGSWEVPPTFDRGVLEAPPANLLLPSPSILADRSARRRD